MKQQTAVKWLIEKIQSDTFCDHIQGVRCWDKDTLMEFLEKAKQMEKEQIVKARYSADQSTDIEKSSEALDQAIKYYNETYGTDKTT